jgi:hypothetical protein
MFLLVSDKQNSPLFGGLQMYKLSPIMQTLFLDLFKWLNAPLANSDLHLYLPLVVHVVYGRFPFLF